MPGPRAPAGAPGGPRPPHVPYAVHGRPGPPGGGPGAVKTTAETAAGPAGRDAESARPIGVLVVDDSLVFRTGRARAVSGCEGLELLGEADGGEAALEAIARLAPEVV